MGGSNVSIRVTGTTYISINSDDVTVGPIKFPDAVFVPLSPFNFFATTAIHAINSKLWTQKRLLKT